MKKILTVSAALLLSVGLSQASLAQGKGNDKDKDRGGPQANRDDGGPGKGRGNGNGNKGGGDRDRGASNAGPGNGNGGGNGKGNRDDRGPDRADRGDDRDRTVVRVDPRSDRVIDRVITETVRGPDRVVVIDRDGDRNWTRGLIAGCPPGLAKKNNGCRPPGQVKNDNVQIVQRNPYDWLFNRYDRYDDRNDRRYDYRYDNGYLYRYDQQGGGLLGYLPLLGGALSSGSIWPSQYRYEPTPTYYNEYYGLNDQYDYRYAGGAIYGVDRQTSTISNVMALLTGQQPQIGQPMPPGYDVYNVPYQYRTQYYDTPQYNYRYNDGYVYRTDPTTQVVQAIIQLLT